MRSPDSVRLRLTYCFQETEQRQDNHLMPQLDTDTEGQDGQDHRSGLHLAHCLKQPTCESESMKQPKEESSAEPAPAPGSARPENILKCDEDNAGGNERLNHPLRQRNEVKSRQRQGYGVSNRKGRDNFYQVAKRRRCQNQCNDEQEVVIASEDVVNALVEKCLKKRSA